MGSKSLYSRGLDIDSLKLCQCFIARGTLSLYPDRRQRFEIFPARILKAKFQFGDYNQATKTEHHIYRNGPFSEFPC